MSKDISDKQGFDQFKTLDEAVAAIHALAPDQLDIDVNERTHQLLISLKYVPEKVRALLTSKLAAEVVTSVMGCLEAKHTFNSVLQLAIEISRLSQSQFEIDVNCEIRQKHLYVTVLTREFVQNLIANLEARMAISKATFEQVGVQLEFPALMLLHLEDSKTQFEAIGSSEEQESDLLCAYRNIGNAQARYKRFIEDAENEFLSSPRAEEFVSFDVVPLDYSDCSDAEETDDC
jgi:hypothetical protein